MAAGANTWTTVGLRRLEERIVSVATAPSRPAMALVAPGPPLDGLDETGRHAVARLTEGGAPVDLVRGDLIGQARVLEVARARWEANGHQVALVSPTERGQARWRTLAGLERPPPPPAHPTVVLVDNAERWSTADLHHIMADASARQAKVVLLDGATLPRRRHAESPAMATLRTSLVAIDVGPAPGLEGGDAWPRRGTDRAVEPAPAAPGRGTDRAVEPTPAAPAAPGAVVHAGREGTVTLAATGREAMDQLVQDWHRRWVAGQRPRMAALGPEEAERLNAMARAARVEAGELRGPSVQIGGRRFQAGDQVAALRRDARLGSVPGGTLGRVTAIDADQDAALIQWAGKDETHRLGADSKGPVPLTHGYATTPSYLRGGHDGPILSLGHVEEVAPRLKPDRIYEVVPAPAADRGHGRGYGLGQGQGQPSPIAGLLAELPSGPGGGNRAPRVLTVDAGRPLAELAAERDRLAEHLLATVPPDTGPELRRLTEERDWLASIPGRAIPGASIPGHSNPGASIPGRSIPGHSNPGRPGPASPTGPPDRAAVLQALDGRRGELMAAARGRSVWLEGHRGQLERWADLSSTIAWRETALGRGAEIRPTVAVQSELGPPPTEAGRRSVWRRAALAIEAHRDRWALPDRPLELDSGAPAAPPLAADRSRRAGELHVLATARELQRSQGRDHALTRSGL